MNLSETHVPLLLVLIDLSSRQNYGKYCVLFFLFDEILFLFCEPTDNIILLYRIEKKNIIIISICVSINFLISIEFVNRVERVNIENGGLEQSCAHACMHCIGIKHRREVIQQQRKPKKKSSDIIGTRCTDN